MEECSLVLGLTEEGMVVVELIRFVLEDCAGQTKEREKDCTASHACGYLRRSLPFPTELFSDLLKTTYSPSLPAY